MRNVSNKYLEAMRTRRDFYAVAEITFTDGVQKTLSKGDFTISGNSITDSAESASFPLGILAAKRITVSLMNDDDRWSHYAFHGAKIFLQTRFDLDDETAETLDIGTFTVISPESYGTTISVTAMDDSYKTDIPYSTSLPYPMTASAALMDSCQTCGIPLLTTVFPNSNFMIQKKPESLTHRQLIGLIAMIAGGNAVFDKNGYLVIKPYDFSAFEKTGDEYGGIFDNLSEERYTTGDDVFGGVFEPWDVGEVDDPVFVDLDNIHFLYDFKSGIKIESDDVVITGVQITSTDDNNESIAHLYGSEGYVLSLENQLADGKESEVAELIGRAVVGLRFRPFSGDHISYPLAEFMDLAYLVDRVGRAYRTVLTDVNFTYYGFTSMKCSADSPIRNSSTYYGNETKAVVQARKATEKQLSVYDLAVQQMNTLAANTMGFFSSTEKLEDGSIVAYRHDKPTREESKIIYKSGIDGFFVSRDGGKTYESGFDSNGNAVLNILSVIGINFDWAHGGTLKLGDYNNIGGKLEVYSDSGILESKIDNEGLTSYFQDWYSLFGAARLFYYRKSDNKLLGEFSASYTSSLETYGVAINAGDENAIIDLGYCIGDNIYSDICRITKNRNLNKYAMSAASGIEQHCDMYIHSAFIENFFVNDLWVNDVAVFSKTPITRSSAMAYSLDAITFGSNSTADFVTDIGAGEIGEDGICYVFLSPQYTGMANTECKYYVSLQKEGQGDLWIKEKSQEYFVVEGTPKLVFSWEIKAKKRGSEIYYMEEIVTEDEKEGIDLAKESADYVSAFFKEMEEIQ